MSRVGKQPIVVPSGVNVEIKPDVITVSGSKGSLSQSQLPGITVTQDGQNLVVGRINDEASSRAKHGLMRSLLDNMVQGVSTGFSKKLELNGVGYRVAMAGTNLKLALGFSHDVLYAVPAGISVGIEQNIITISGIDKQLVGQVAADIRALKKPEPYKGKGIRYTDEYVIRKSGKSGKEAK